MARHMHYSVKIGPLGCYSDFDGINNRAGSTIIANCYGYLENLVLLLWQPLKNPRVFILKQINEHPYFNVGRAVQVLHNIHMVVICAYMMTYCCRACCA